MIEKVYVVLSKATQFGKAFYPVMKAEYQSADEPAMKDPVTTLALFCTPTVTVISVMGLQVGSSIR